MRPDRTDSVPAIGGTSLLVIFGVLCLTVFSLLTLTTAQAQKRLSDSAAQTCAAYYEADRQAGEVFALLRSGQMPPQVQKDGNLFRYSIPISSRQSLQVQLIQKDGWHVLCWQSAAAATPIQNQSLSLWDGNSNQEDSP